MDALMPIANFLKAKERTARRRYYIPEAWNYFGYPDYERDSARPNELLVCPYHFFRSCLEGQILGATETAGSEAGGVHAGAGAAGTVEADAVAAEDLTGQVIYSMFPRCFTAWTHDQSGRVYPGTFLKSMALLPLLKEYGVDIV